LLFINFNFFSIDKQKYYDLYQVVSPITDFFGYCDINYQIIASSRLSNFDQVLSTFQKRDYKNKLIASDFKIDQKDENFMFYYEKLPKPVVKVAFLRGHLRRSLLILKMTFWLEAYILILKQFDYLSIVAS